MVMVTPEQLMRPEVLARSAYAVPDSRGLLKLDAMENPFPWPGSGLFAQWQQALADVTLNRYPDPQAHALRARLRVVHGLPEQAGCLLGNGSDELIQILLTAVQGSGRPVVAPVPTFVMYEVIARALGVPFVGVPLGANFALDQQALLTTMAEVRPAIVFLAYPNNPTGVLYPAADVAEVVAANPGLTVIDEAYAPFSEHSFLPEAGNPSGLMVLRTLSKLGLAGLRLGYLVAAPDWIDALDRIRLPYNIGSLTQLSALFALDHADDLEIQAGIIRAERSRLFAALAAMPGVVKVFPSAANFLLFEVTAGQGSAVFTGLRTQGILIKNLDAPGGVLADHLRVTVGTPEQNTRFLAVLADVLLETGTRSRFGQGE